MKKTYEAPAVEVVKFQYRDQVVVASNSQTPCTVVRGNAGSDCKTDELYWQSSPPNA